MNDEKVYEELGRNYRFFATWRHLAFAASAAIWVVVLKLADSRGFGSGVVIVASLVGAGAQILLLLIDARTRVHTDAAIQQGAELEGQTKGFFSAMKARNKWPTHTFSARVWYIVSAALLILSIVANW